VNLHVLEDDRIISWLGRQKTLLIQTLLLIQALCLKRCSNRFEELCIHVIRGCQDGVSFFILHLRFLYFSVFTYFLFSLVLCTLYVFVFFDINVYHIVLHYSPCSILYF
jgi:hypothetical protein